MSYFIFDIHKNNLKEDEIHHIKDVLRFKPNTTIKAVDGVGNLYNLKIISLKPFYAEIIDKKSVPRDEIYTRCIIATIKTPLLELIIQKLTEIGIDEIIITKTNFSQIGIDKLKNKLNRWHNIAITACKQAERAYFPKIYLQNLDEIKYINNEIKLIGDTQYTPNAKSILEIDYNNIEKISLLIGPEGGFEFNEYNNFVEKEKYIPVKCASNILKSETAAIVIAGIIKAMQL